MAGVGVLQRPSARVENSVEQRNKFFRSGIGVEHGIDLRAYARWREVFRGKRADGGLYIGHQQSGRNAFAGDVSNANGQFVLAQADDVVIIAAYHARRFPGSGNCEFGQLGNVFGQEPALNVLGLLQFFGLDFPYGRFDRYRLLQFQVMPLQPARSHLVGFIGEGKDQVGYERKLPALPQEREERHWEAVDPVNRQRRGNNYNRGHGENRGHMDGPVIRRPPILIKKLHRPQHQSAEVHLDQNIDEKVADVCDRLVERPKNQPGGEDDSEAKNLQPREAIEASRNVPPFHNPLSDLRRLKRWFYGNCVWPDGKRLGLTLSEILVKLITNVGVALRLFPQFLRVFRLALGQHLEARLLQQEFLDLTSRGARIENHRVLASPAAFGVVAVEQPLSGFDCDFLIGHRGCHVDAMRDAMRISDDQAGPVVGFGFEERLQRVLVFGAQGYAGHVNVAIAHRH